MLTRALNVVNCDPSETLEDIRNRVVVVGYGSGTTRLRVVVDDDTVNSDGHTSQDLYGVRSMPYENPDLISMASAVAEGKQVIADKAWPRKTYTATILRGWALVLHPGDTVALNYKGLFDTVRVTEIRYANNGLPASLLLGPRTPGLGDAVGGALKKIARLNKV